MSDSEISPSDYALNSGSVWPPPPEGVEDPGSPGYLPTDIRAFDEQNCWVVLLLMIVTLGLYQPFWLMKISKVINRVAPDRSIPLMYFWTLIGLLVANYVAELIAATLQVLYPNSAQSVENVRRLFGYGVAIYSLFLLFKVKDAMNYILWRTFPRWERFSGLGTFFFGALSLQIQLNKFIRKEAK